MKEKKYLIAFNPVSGNRDDKMEVLEYAQNQLNKAGHSTELWETTGDNDREKFGEVVESRDVNVIVAAGGDGTIKMASDVALEREKPLGILPLGSANGLATCLDIEDIDRALEVLKNGRNKAYDLLKINGENCVHIADFGFNAGLIRHFENLPSRGIWSYFVSSLRQLRETDLGEFEIVCGGEKKKIEAYMLVMSHWQQYGTGFSVNPRGIPDDGLFEIIPIGPEQITGILNIGRALFEENEHPDLIRCDSAIIRNINRAPFQIDGEVRDNPIEVEVESIPGYLKLLSE